MRALEVGLGDLELLVEFGGFDGGHELTLGDVLADVDEPLPEVAAGARVDGRVVEGLRIAGQRDLGGGAGDDGRDYVYGRDCIELCLRCEVALVRHTADEAIDDAGEGRSMR